MPKRTIHSGCAVEVNAIPPMAAEGRENAKLVTFVDMESGDRDDYPIGGDAVEQLIRDLGGTPSRIQVVKDMPPEPPGA